MKNTPTPLERILELFREKFLGCNVEDCAGQFCSKHQFKQEVVGKLPAEFEAFITHAYEVGRNDAVDFIDREFNDERYAHFAGEDDDDEPVSTEEGAEFRMFWTDLLRAARGEGK